MFFTCSCLTSGRVPSFGAAGAVQVGSVSLTAGILWGSSQEGVYDVCGTAQPVRTEGLFTAPPSGCLGCYNGGWGSAQRVAVSFRNLAQKSAAPVARCSRTESLLRNGYSKGWQRRASK